MAMRVYYGEVRSCPIKPSELHKALKKWMHHKTSFVLLEGRPPSFWVDVSQIRQAL